MMNIPVLNGSPRKKGTVAILLKGIVGGIDEKHTQRKRDPNDQ